jgi:hypothetical protein
VPDRPTAAQSHDILAVAVTASGHEVAEPGDSWRPLRAPTREQPVIAAKAPFHHEAFETRAMESQVTTRRLPTARSAVPSSGSRFAARCVGCVPRAVYSAAMRRLLAMHRLVPLGLAIITFFVFLPALRNGFVWDDARNLVTNPHYRGLGWVQLRWIATAIHLGHYIR